MTHSDFPSDLSAPRPTRVRYLIVLVSMLMSVVLYLDRMCVSLAVDYIREDISLTQTDISWFLSAFFWSYALAQVPAGWLSDRFGPRIMLVLYIVSWSFFTAMIGAVYSFAFLILTRLGIGIAQAGAYPSCGTLLKQWVPVSGRASASSVVAFGGRVGGALAPFLTAWLIVLSVPANAPLELTSADLLSGTDVIQKLAAAAQQDSSSLSPQRRAFELLSTADQTFVRETAQSQPADSKEPWKLSDEQSTQVVALLNSLMSRDDLYSKETFESVRLNSEVTGLLRDKEQRSLTPREQLRVNRLLLEATFPAGIKKLYVLGWRPVMYYYGAAGFVVAAIFWLYFRDSPQQHPHCNEAERNLIAGEDVAALVIRAEAAAEKKHEPLPVVAILTDFSLWCCCISQIGTNIGWLFLVSWLPRYLSDVHEVPVLSRGFMATLTVSVGMVGLLVGGPMTDWLTRKWGLKWGRRGPMLATRFLAMSGYLLALVLSTLPADSPLNSPWAFVVSFALVSLGTDMGIAAVWALMQDIGGKNVGAILGWGNMWGNLGAAVAPPIYNFILGEHPALKDWNIMFVVCAAAFVLSGLTAFGIDATKPVGGNSDAMPSAADSADE